MSAHQFLFSTLPRTSLIVPAKYRIKFSFNLPLFNYRRWNLNHNGSNMWRGGGNKNSEISVFIHSLVYLLVAYFVPPPRFALFLLKFACIFFYAGTQRIQESSCQSALFLLSSLLIFKGSYCRGMSSVFMSWINMMNESISQNKRMRRRVTYWCPTIFAHALPLARMNTFKYSTWIEQ